MSSYNTCNDNRNIYPYTYMQGEYLSRAINLINAMDYNTLLSLYSQMDKIIEKKKKDMYNGGIVSNVNY